MDWSNGSIFVGRREEVEILRSAVLGVPSTTRTSASSTASTIIQESVKFRRTKRHVFFIEGPSGIGKSTLVQHSIAETASLGVLLVTAKFEESQSSVPLFPWIHAAKCLLRSVKSSSGKTSQELADYLKNSFQSTTLQKGISIGYWNALRRVFGHGTFQELGLESLLLELDNNPWSFRMVVGTAIVHFYY